tara:strand:+ start:12145 stop:12513 length:369 start_codon:yes stop_codon:yes gene_type:complete
VEIPPLLKNTIKREFNKVDIFNKYFMVIQRTDQPVAHRGMRNEKGRILFKEKAKEIVKRSEHKITIHGTSLEDIAPIFNLIKDYLAEHSGTPQMDEEVYMQYWDLFLDKIEPEEQIIAHHSK